MYRPVRDPLARSASLQILTLPRIECGGFLVPRVGLPLHPLGYSSRGHLSPSVLGDWLLGSPVPQGTLQCFDQDVSGGILIAVYDQATGGTHMCSGGEGLLDTLPTARTVLAGVLWCNGDDWHIMHDAVGLDPVQKLAPCRIMDALGQFAVLDQVADLQVFVGNQVVRRDERVRRFASEIFTLPLHFQRRFRQSLSGLLAVLALFLFTRDAPMETLEFRLGLSVVALVFNGIPIGVGVEELQAHVDANDAARLDMFALALCLDTELDIVSISTTEDANSFDLLDGEGFDLLARGTNQAEATNATAIDKGDMTPIGVNLPSCLLIFHTAVVVLKLGVSLLSRLLVAAILIEARDGSPGTIRTGLTSLGIEVVGKGVLFCQNGTIALQVILVDFVSVHPKTEALVANELHHADRFIDSRVLLLIAVQFVLRDQHCLLPFRVFSAILIIHQRKMYCQGESHEFNTDEYLSG